jgi:Photosynthetic reaction centre cytochrome C subunit
VNGSFYIFNHCKKMQNEVKSRRAGKKNKIFIVAFGISAFIAMGMALPDSQQRNLKVLPKDISDAKLDSIMKSYTVALGVQCGFCHVAAKHTAVKDSLDYTSDADPMKENARGMMRMVIDINKTYFYFDKETQPEYLNVVHCKTCHNGEPIPPNK